MAFLRLGALSVSMALGDPLADDGLCVGSGAEGNGNWDWVGRSHGDSMSSSAVLGVGSGVGEARGARSLRKLKGALCGRGEMSIESGTKHGEDDGIGGVVTPSHLKSGVLVPSASDKVSTAAYAEQNVSFLPRLLSSFREKSDRRGVWNWGLEQY